MKITKEQLAKLIKEELENEGYKPKGKAYKKYDDEEYMEEAALISEEEPGAIDVDSIMVSFADHRGERGQWVIELGGKGADERFWQRNVRTEAGIEPEWGAQGSAKGFHNDDEGKMKALSSWFKLNDYVDGHNLVWQASGLQNESAKITISQLSKLIAEQVTNPMGSSEELLSAISEMIEEPGDAQDKLNQIGMMINIYFGS